MNKFLNTILRSAIAASLSDREVFTDRIAKVLEDKIGNDPDKAHEIGDKIASVMENLDEQLLIDQLISSQEPSHDALHEKIDKLTAAIERLNANLEKIQK